MPPNLFPFLYRTRTLQRACRRPTSFFLVQRASLATRPKDSNPNPNRADSSIPFEWDNEEHAKGHESTLAAEAKPSTITPSEVDIFKGIFDEIAQGRMPKPKRRPEFPDTRANRFPPSLIDGADSDASGDQPMASSIVDQARGSEFSDQFLQRYPQSLRTAAEVALGKFELAPKRPRLSDMIGLDEAEAKQMAEWKRYGEIRNQEKERVDALMTACRSDIELWHVMEKEVFSLPEKLGIAQVAEVKSAISRGRKPKKQTAKEASTEQPEKPATKRGKKSKKQASTEQPEPVAVPDSEEPGTMIMDVHGPLYPHYLATGLGLFDTAFAQPSPLAFNILPRIRSLGLPSYVLGISTPLFHKLAQIHWNRYGDLVSAVETMEEMRSVGLYSDPDIETLLTQIREQLHGCAWGAQGRFVMAMTELPPYDSSLDNRLEELANYTIFSFKQQGLQIHQRQEDEMELDLGLEEDEGEGEGEGEDDRKQHSY
ncbi:hypothetical protein BGZ61DRAFT_459565 [Ilyonectria robusta]|uniref:uncharacterized protein n=1 Tax=Ilyonectria robusta TaxID=1079257 RepID=UPI001E8E52BB|nr:uncharacterized protein BGZ61DRAFT_459565 [Ilyonectria robusta]KAH8670551.1 hypothetical protein BGZ61DRAFT_459565 [Ilyonectria robusta]